MINKSITFLETIASWHHAVFKTNKNLNLLNIESCIYNVFNKEDWKPITKWLQFENGCTEYTTNEIFNIFDIKKTIKNDFFIITMESYKYNTVFYIPTYKHFEYFIENYDFFVSENIEFMQPMNYIVISLDNIVMIHHNGLKAIYSKNYL
ncbi:hypothetical protein [Hugenholtzia roseola]|uniref:hypothetical protein n=1 Tax=Hugenholtzia roseola TaxID=1002 RepID=UPI001376ABE3|nr:hypothetical protein [Hugenholtzia roseola]